jgi:CRP/FNR family cyclic AMP-dependent transcriptional regulator
MNFGDGVIWIDALGYLSACMVIATHSMKTMIKLRVTSIAASFLFIIYGFLAPSYPQVLLHGVLLPLNAFRLRQMMSLVEQVSGALTGSISMEWLHTYSTRISCKKGDMIFGKGEAADTMYYTLSGRFHLIESGIEIAPGNLVGEIGLVSPGNNRTQSFAYSEDGELLSIGYERVKELYFQNPKFGFYFLNLIAQRLIANNALLEEKLGETRERAAV